MKLVAHIINGLGVGGAEQTLCNLITGAGWHEFNHVVYSLQGPGPLGDRLKQIGITVEPSNRRLTPIPNLIALGPFLARVRPDVVQTWMYHSNLAGSIFAGRTNRPLVWNIRHAAPTDLKPTTRLVSHACARMSATKPAAIVCCSHDSATKHAAAGYCESKIRVIHNGFDTAAFAPDPAARASFRAELALGPNQPVVGMIARHHPVKGHEIFLRAAAHLARDLPDVSFVMAGRGVTPDNSSLGPAVMAAGLAGRCRLLGERNDMTRVLNGLDVLVSSSHSEGMPNIIGEAMACGVVCVATDVGDTRHLVGAAGHLVPPGDPQAIATACRAIFAADDRAAAGAAARQRIVERFDARRTLQNYEDLYRTVTNPCAE